MHIFFISPLFSYCPFIYDVFLGVCYVFWDVFVCFWVFVVFLGKSMNWLIQADLYQKYVHVHLTLYQYNTTNLEQLSF